MYIVLVTEGKHESVDYVTVYTFATKAEAKACVDSEEHRFDPDQKYWISAEIVERSEKIELCRPQE